MGDLLKKTNNSSVANNAEEKDHEEIFTPDQIALMLQQVQANISEWFDREPSEALWFVNEVQQQINNKVDIDQLNGVKLTMYYKYLQSFFNRTTNYLAVRKDCKPIIIKPDLTGNMEYDLSRLTAFELALRYWYLEKGKIEPYIGGPAVGSKYSHIKSGKNIEGCYNNIANKRRSAKKAHLQNVHNSLSKYPDIQKAIENDIDKL